MTEEQWLASDDPARMLAWRPKKGSARKRRLFACACVRRVWRSLRDERSRTAVEVAERFADGEARAAELKKACDEALTAAVSLPAPVDRNRGYRFAASAAYCAARPTLSAATARTSAYESTVAAGRREAAQQARLVRCVFGNPFRRVTLEEAWRAPAVTALALAAYEERSLPGGALDPVRLAVLADALEEAGCGEEVYGHLRQPGPHARGCWVIDLVLGRE